MSERTRQNGCWTIGSLVLLRLAIGWHFYREGSSKVGYDRSAGRFELTFSAEPFLSQAKGPLAGWFRSLAPAAHDWPTLLAIPRQDVPLTDEQLAERVQWQADYDKRRAEAVRKGDFAPIEFPPTAPYHDWAKRIFDDWHSVLSDVMQVARFTDNDRRRAAVDAFVSRHQQLADYLADETEAIAEYQHELWRLKEMRAAPEADGAPFAQQRIAAKSEETARRPLKWVRWVGDLENEYLADLRDKVLADERNVPATEDLDEALTMPGNRRLHALNVTVTILTIAVGVCLLLGLLTRLAAVAGAVFLVGVIAAQPPWAAGAAPTYYQTIELAGLLVLAVTGPGRWAGLDYFGYAFCHRLCRRKTTAE
jgi:uncharacterized membrane protein YphA (DoxX/SURF4 family)